MNDEEIAQGLAYRFIQSFLLNGRITKEQMFRAFEIVKERLTPKKEEEGKDADKVQETSKDQ